MIYDPLWPHFEMIDKVHGLRLPFFDDTKSSWLILVNFALGTTQGSHLFQFFLRLLVGIGIDGFPVKLIPVYSAIALCWVPD